MICERSVGSLGELISQATEICGVHPHDRIWFRGHEDAAWQLRPRIYRDFSPEQETSLAASFILEAPIRYANAPAPGDLPRWLSLMQHYRMPTRLLDWTRSPLVAAFFALSHNRQCDSVIWGAFPFRLNEIEAGVDKVLPLPDPAVAPFVLSAFGLEQTPAGVRAVLAETIDIRMLVQQAAFTLHGDCEPLEQRYAARNDVLVKFILPKAAQDRMYAELVHSGVTRSHLFPDLENLATSLTTRPRCSPR